MGLIDKNTTNSSLGRVDVPSPTKTFNRNDFLSINDDTTSDKSHNPSTSIRCKRSVSDELNSLTTIMNFDSFILIFITASLILIIVKK